MITLKLEGDALVPRVLCDACGEPIDGGRGNAEWVADLDGSPIVGPFHVHKGRCTLAIHERYPGSKSYPGRGWLWQELGFHLVYAALNSGYRLPDLMRRHDELRESGLHTGPRLARGEGAKF
jgi:hypothetical protein